MRLSSSLKVHCFACALFVWVSGCGQSHSDASSQAGSDYQHVDPDAGAQATDKPSDSLPTKNEPAMDACPDGAPSLDAIKLDTIAPGVAELEIYSDSLGGELPVTFSAHCDQQDGLLNLMATDGLSTFRFAASEPGAGGMVTDGSFEFEDLATFNGHCNVCLTDRAGALSCPSLVWKTGNDWVKASVRGAFRCEPND